MEEALRRFATLLAVECLELVTKQADAGSPISTVVVPTLVMSQPKMDRAAAADFGGRYPRYTGPIWLTPMRRRSRLVEATCRVLAATYRPTRLGNPHDPVDDLVYIVITNRSSPATSKAVFGEVKRHYSSWNLMLSRDDERKLADILRPLGMAKKKSAMLIAAFQQMRGDFGEVSLTSLRSLPTPAAEAYLSTLPGVSTKVAKCVLMYAFDRDVLPVDVHVHRLASRLGWVARKRADQCHQELEELVPAPLRRRFHVNAIQHGRSVCRPTPGCDSCVLNKYCAYYATHAAADRN